MNIYGINQHLSELFREWNQRNGSAYSLVTSAPVHYATRWWITERATPVYKITPAKEWRTIDGIALNKVYDHLELIEALKEVLNKV